VAVFLFYNPYLVEQLAACGITPHGRPLPPAPARGYVQESHRRPQRAQKTVTNVVSVQGGVTITAARQPAARRPAPFTLPALPTLPAPAFLEPPEPQPATARQGVEQPERTADLAEECDRLRRDNQRLAGEVARLRAELDRLTARGAASQYLDPRIKILGAECLAIQPAAQQPDRADLEPDDASRRFFALLDR